MVWGNRLIPYRHKTKLIVKRIQNSLAHYCFTLTSYDGLWWRHQMKTFSVLLALCTGNSAVTDEFRNKGQWRGALIFSLICAQINDWVNNREAGGLRCYCAHHNVIVIPSSSSLQHLPNKINNGVCHCVSTETLSKSDLPKTNSMEIGLIML